VIILEAYFIIEMELLCQILTDNVKVTYKNATPNYTPINNQQCRQCLLLHILSSIVYNLSLVFAKLMDGDGI
jgi:hypothetical protein